MDERDEILVIDDDEGTRKTLTLILKKKGFDVITAGTGDEGLKQARGRKVAIALLDINLPDIEGIRLIAPLKEMHPDLAVIMITGFASMENAMRALNEGATGYVLKPVNIDEILLKIHDALERQHLIKTKLRAEEALRKSEHRSAMLLEALPDMMFVLSRDGVYRDFSVPDKSALAVPPDQIIGKNIHDVGFNRDVADAILHHIAQAIDTNKPQKFEYELLIPQGLRQYDARLVALNGDEVLGIVQDITDRKQAEEALRDSEERFRTMIEQSPLSIEVMSPDGRTLQVNPAFVNLWGVTLEDLKDYNMLKDEQLISLGIMPYIQRGFSGEAVAYPPLEYDGSKTLGFGEKKWVQGSIYPVRDTAGTIRNVILVHEDITEQKNAEGALRESEQRFRDIFNNTSDVILLHEIRDDGTPGRFTDVNDVTCRMLGYTREEMFTKTPLAITTDFHNPPLEKILEEQRTTGGARFETEYRAKDGTIIPVEISTRVITLQGKRLMLGNARDITERKKAEDLLKHFNEELEQEVKVRTGELSASLEEKVVLLREVHHRVKNNLQIIISLVNLQMRQIDDKRLKQVMAETQNRVRAMSLVHEKLYQSTDIAHIDLASYTRFLVTHLISFYGVDSRQVALNIDIGKIMVGINTAIPLGLIINELASNALKHAFPNGKTGSLSITVREVEKTLNLSIKDDGVGVPADFDWRNAESLGLRLVISLVEQLDGTIELDRSAGTAFTIMAKEKE